MQVITTEDEEGRALRMGARGVLTKPLRTRDELDSTLGAFERSGRGRRAACSSSMPTRPEVKSWPTPRGRRRVDRRCSTVESAAKALARGPHEVVVLGVERRHDAHVRPSESFCAIPTSRILPVLVYSPGELGADGESRSRSLSRRAVVKQVDSRERLFDQAALFLHRRLADMPEPRRRELEGLRDSSVALAGKQVLIVDDDIRNIFAMTSLLDAHGMNVISAETGEAAIAALETTPGHRGRADGHHDAGDGRVRNDAHDPKTARISVAAHHCRYGQGDEGRSRKMLRGGGDRLHLEARRSEPAHHHAAGLAAPLRVGRGLLG